MRTIPQHLIYKKMKPESPVQHRVKEQHWQNKRELGKVDTSGGNRLYKVI